MKEQLISKLQEIEKNLSLYQSFIDSGVSEDDRKVVSFKVLYEMMAFSALLEFVPEYVPASSTNYMMTSNGLKKLADYASVKDNKVAISPEYKKLLTERDAFLKSNKN
jgi:hypothetical protein